MSEKDRYLKRGVSSQKEDVHKAIQNIDKGIFPNAFCKVVPDILGGDKDWCNIVHADGAGTKSSLAYMYWKETGDLNVWKGIAQDALVMNLDDMLCLGLTGPFLMSNTIGRNKHLIPVEVISAIIQGMEEFCNQMRHYGIEIYSTGGETADVGDIVKTVLIDSTFTARVKRSLVKEVNIQAGDVIIGLASYGQTKYENEYNAGMGSNGLTSARHDLLNSEYIKKYPESFDSNTNKEYIYTGPFMVTDLVKEIPVNIGRAILSPTRTFAPFIKSLTTAEMFAINGIIHCTGGGQTKVLKFTDQIHIIKDNLLPIPPLFQLIKEYSGSSDKEMFEVFNMGHRMEIYLPEKFAGQLLEKATDLGINAGVIGHCEASIVKELTVLSEKEKISWK